MFTNHPVTGSAGSTIAPIPAVRQTSPAGAAAHAELIRSVDILSGVAGSRPGGVIQGAELVSMACNDDGRYSSQVQHAARVFLSNGGWVGRARDAVRRRGNNPHSASAGGRAYDFHDLRSMYEYMQQHPQESHGNQEEQHGGGYAFIPTMNVGQSAEPDSGALLAQMMVAIQHLLAEMRDLRRQHMSLQRLMSMGERGNPGAQYLLEQPDMLSGLLNNMVRRNMAINIRQLETMGVGIGSQAHFNDLQQNIGGGAFAGGFPSSDTAGFSAAGVSRNWSPEPGPVHPAAQDTHRAQQLHRDVFRGQALQRNHDTKESTQAASLRDDTLRREDVRAAQARADVVGQQRREDDDEAERRRHANDQRLADRS